jgi:hypothetical protein
MTPDLDDQPLLHQLGQFDVAVCHIFITQLTKRFFFSRRNIIFLILAKPMQKHQTFALAMGGDRPKPASFAPTERADPLSLSGSPLIWH